MLPLKPMFPNEVDPFGSSLNRVLATSMLISAVTNGNGKVRLKSLSARP
jgi:hypothetical protein